jgi:hypothetical protein
MRDGCRHQAHDGAINRTAIKIPKSGQPAHRDVSDGIAVKYSRRASSSVKKRV